MNTASCNYIYAFYSTCLDFGADAQSLLTVLDEGPAPFKNPLRRFRCDAVLDMLALAKDITGNASLGVHTGRNFRPSTFLDVGYALISCRSLRHALEVNAKYQQLTQQLGTTKLVVEGGVSQVLWTPYIDHWDRMRPVTEAAFAGYVSIGRWLLWLYDEDALTVRFRHAKPCDPDPCAEYFGCDILYEQEMDCLEFKGSLADAKLPQHNPELLAQLEVRLERALANLREDAKLSTRTFQCIEHVMVEGPPHIGRVAAALGVSETSLARGLRKENTSFRDILQEVRKQNAQLFINEGRKSLSEIALALGYSDQSAFTRAYKSWFGHSPTASQKGMDGRETGRS
jgi:AraC-like DNA-binding protein